MKHKRCVMFFVFSFLLCISQKSFADEYNKFVNELYQSKDFLEYVRKDFFGGSLNSVDTLYYFRMCQYNDELFKNGEPNCNLSDKDNICFKVLSQLEAVTLLLQDKRKGFNALVEEQYYKLPYELQQKTMYINTELFYVWKNAVLKGLNIEEFLYKVDILQNQKKLLLRYTTPR